jgi:hypothetical protein
MEQNESTKQTPVWDGNPAVPLLLQAAEVIEKLAALTAPSALEIQKELPAGFVDGTIAERLRNTAAVAR